MLDSTFCYKGKAVFRESVIAVVISLWAQTALAATTATAAFSPSDEIALLDKPVEVERAAGVHQTVPLQHCDLWPYVLRVKEITESYPSGATNAQIRDRNGKIRMLFEETLYIRELPRWRAHQAYQYVAVRCKNSRSGQVKKCPGSMNWSTDYKVIPESMANSGRHFKRVPVIAEPNVVSWIIGTTGKGTNTGWIKASAQFTESAITAGIESDRARLRRALEDRSLPTDRAIDPSL